MTVDHAERFLHRLFDFADEPPSQAVIDLCANDFRRERDRSNLLMAVLAATHVSAAVLSIAVFCLSNADAGRLAGFGPASAIFLLFVLGDDDGIAGRKSRRAFPAALLAPIAAYALFRLAFPTSIPAVQAVAFQRIVGIGGVFALIPEVLLVYRADSFDDLAKRLDPMDPSHCPDVLGWCRRDPQLGAYQRKVAAQDRLFTEHERTRMTDHIRTEHGIREAEDRERSIQDACRALRDPIPERNGA